MEEMRNALKIMVTKAARSRCRFEYNIKMDLKRNRFGVCGLDSSGSGLGKMGWALLNMEMNLRVSQKTGNFLTI
jgi:hypothetical protein